MAEKFLSKEYTVVEFEKKADIYIINTCTVTNMSDRKSRQIIRRVKTKNPKSVLVVTGCYAQVASKDLENIKDIDLIIGNTEKKNIVDIVENYIEKCKSSNKKDIKKINLTDINQEKNYIDFGTTTYTEKTRAVIKVQDGCNNFCSYCIIPYAKGRVRSRSIESITKEISDIIKKGIKEVIITGIHVASYGIDFKKDKIGLIDLLEEINKIEGIKRIRLGSLEPTIITDEFVERLKNLDKICDQFHLSLQSGCDETLKRMNRKYNTEDFEKVTYRLRKAFPSCTLTTDIIVGFPGETEEEFKTTYNYLKNIKFYKMHVFKYSPRKGTIAESMKCQIDGKIKEERSHKLIQLSNKNEKEFLEKYLNKEIEVLFEQKENGYYKGHTTNYIVVNAKGNGLSNKILKIRITKQKELELYGKTIET